MPKLRDYVLIADDVYLPAKQSAPPADWKLVHGLAVDAKDGAPGVTTSLQCRAYRHSVRREAIVGYRGTYCFGDVAAYPSVGLYWQGRHMTEALKVSKEWIAQLKDEKYTVTLTGHSLGGAIAQVAGYHLKCRFVTFNAPGMLANTPGISAYVANPWSSDNVERGMNYIAWGDPVGNYGRHIGDTTRVKVAGVRFVVAGARLGAAVGSASGPIGTGVGAVAGGLTVGVAMNHGIANFVQLLTTGGARFAAEADPLG